MIRAYIVVGILSKAVPSFYYIVVSGECWIETGLYEIYMDGVARKVNSMSFGKSLELYRAHGDWFEINQLLFADDTALVADSEEKL